MPLGHMRAAIFDAEFERMSVWKETDGEGKVKFEQGEILHEGLLAQSVITRWSPTMQTWRVITVVEHDYMGLTNEHGEMLIEMCYEMSIS